MRYYKMISDGYLLSAGIGTIGEEITESEYNTILEIICSKPAAPDGYDYKLTDCLEWELYEMPRMEAEEGLTETEEKARAYDILMGVAG